MESSAAGLLAELHGHCLRALGKVVGGEFDGLSTMARAALKRGLISALLKKKLEHLDIAVAYNRHAYDGKMRGFQDWLHAELSDGPGSGGGAVASASSAASSGSDVDFDGGSEVHDVSSIPPKPPGPVPVSRPRLVRREPPGELHFPPKPLGSAPVSRPRLARRESPGV